MSQAVAAAPRVLCRLEEIEDGEARGFTLDDPGPGGGDRCENFGNLGCNRDTRFEAVASAQDA